MKNSTKIRLAVYIAVTSLFIYTMCSCKSSCSAGYCDAYGSTITNQEIDKVQSPYLFFKLFTMSKPKQCRACGYRSNTKSCPQCNCNVMIDPDDYDWEKTSNAIDWSRVKPKGD